MIIFKQTGPLSQYLQRQKNEGKTTGFVPTMGALHDGHLVLIKTSNKENDLTICSIFVNPSQFNNQDDLKKYPVTTEKDIELLITNGCHILFLPSVDEIYPPGHIKKQYALGDLENILEGKYRPGHFQGVCQVVDRLLQVVKPHILYLGQKDFQQCMVIKRLLQLTGKKKEIELKIEPTVREKDGLAMSSRNMRLTPLQKTNAAVIYQTLLQIKKNISTSSIKDVKNTATKKLTDAGFVVDYVEIVNADTLEPMEVENNSLAVIAASIGGIRLIDNMKLY